MNDVQSHRGPDGEGVQDFPARDGSTPATLGHRRLSIIDPTPRGAQPMVTADGRYCITYNGELYNFPQLRAELEADGFKFRSDCDTEVLLELYARHGAAMLERINGMFAFAVWDTEANSLFIARDRVGVKPLYYRQHDGVLYFSSEIKALLEGSPAPSLRQEALPEYLTFLWVPDPDTLFEGIQKLPPGHCATYAGETLSIRQYWNQSYEVDSATDSAEWPGRVKGTVQEAIRRQMISDVPTGAFLSGGLDSGAIVATMRGELGNSFPTYTVGFAEEDLAAEIVPDDLRYARTLADDLAVEYNERILDPDIVDLLPRLIWHLDEPVADPAAITTYLICSAARERMTVILSGIGGDEVFAGYPRHLAAQLTRPVDRIPRSARTKLRETLEGRLTIGRPGRMRGPRRNLMKLLRGIDQPPLDRYLTHSSYYREEELNGLLSSELRASLGPTDPFRRHREHAASVADENWLNRLLYIDMKTFLPCLNLTYTDKMSMAASTEVRVPLLDDEVVDLSGRIPPKLKLHRLTRKYVLKKSMRGVLPRRNIWRPKAGFGAPLRSWVGGALRPMVDDLLSPSNLKLRGLVDPVAVANMREDDDAGLADNSLRIWALLVLELWMREFGL